MNSKHLLGGKPGMTPITEKLLQEMTGAIVEVVDPQRIILFGSYARGQAGPNSDVDLLIVEDHPSDPGWSRRQEISRIRRCLWGYRVPIDILVSTPQEMEHWKDARNHVIARALKEGRVVYERS